ncbi:MAG: HD domain-containing protein [Dehalococcoidales bacterium]|jgi:PAS domain S-box-containing protein/putative nucleotidyltransferase with HDIG domain|nr:HD domain-containing protein [Dehalococcoidales bacterium]
MKGNNFQDNQIPPETGNLISKQNNAPSSEHPEASIIRDIRNLLRSNRKSIPEGTKAVIVTDKDLHILLWNQNAELIYGWNASEATASVSSEKIRNHVFNFLSRPEILEKLLENWHWDGDIQTCDKYGTALFIRISVDILWDKNGNFNGLVTIHEPTQSITTSQNKTYTAQEVEAAVRQRTDELLKANQILQQELEKHRKIVLIAQESEGKNRDLADNIKLGIFRSTPGARGRFLEVNLAMEEITGYSREELLQMDVCDLFEDKTERNLFTDGIGITNWNETREINLRKKSGEIITVAENIMTIRYDSGRIVYFDGILEDITERKRAQKQIQESLERLQKTIKEIVQAMAYIGEVRDPYTAGHQRRVAQLSFEIARILGLPDTQHEGLMMAAFVHDIGKILVPADILSKPGKLTKPEFDMIKDHARIGYEILKTIEFPWPLAKIVLQHHERLNGSGYPSGLQGDQILLEARILAVADVVEAMSSHRPYRPALGIDQALEEITRNRGILYDPTTVDACLKLFHEQGFNLN